MTTTTINDLTAHQRAQDTFGAVLRNVSAVQLGASTPCSAWSVLDLIGHVIGGNQRVAGATVSLPADVSGLREAHAGSGADAQEIFEEPDGVTRTFKVPFGDVPGAVFLQLRATDVFTHAWDLARATDQSTDLDGELAQYLLEGARQLIRPEFRGPQGPFADEEHCDPTRPAADRLAAYLGRGVS